MKKYNCSICGEKFSFEDNLSGPNTCGDCLNIIGERMISIPEILKKEIKSLSYSNNFEKIHEIIFRHKLSDFELLKIFWESWEEEKYDLLACLKKLNLEGVVN